MRNMLSGVDNIEVFSVVSSHTTLYDSMDLRRFFVEDSRITEELKPDVTKYEHLIFGEHGNNG